MLEFTEAQVQYDTSHWTLIVSLTKCKKINIGLWKKYCFETKSLFRLREAQRIS